MGPLHRSSPRKRGPTLCDGDFDSWAPRPRGRTEKDIFDCQTAEFRRPQLWSGLGFARLLFPSPNEGSGAPRRRMAWISPDRPGFSRAGPERRDPDAHDACVRVLSTRHAASPALRLQRFGRTGPQSLCRGRAPRRRPGTWLTFATLAGAASRPTFTTPRDDAPRWTGRFDPR